MNIIEKEAVKFYEKLYNNENCNTLENIKDYLTTKLYDFNRDKDKLDFLKILRNNSVEDRDDHNKTYTGGGSAYSEERDIGIFAIDQEIDDINRYYSFEPKSEDRFSADEESGLHVKLNEIIDKLEKQGYGQEIIFDEIEDLKNHFNLGKKNWFQLLKGKVIDLSYNNVLNKTIVKEIYETLSEGFDEVVKLIE